ncbi:TBC1 domain family member 21 isoform X3 [Oryctolagus cuniculus]|uniref:TBC1 domain family member 21 isoform X3 n=1 Tax=Oryctolagus cuniculus TaxID=9986 RepID=UPI003879C0FE
MTTLSPENSLSARRSASFILVKRKPPIDKTEWDSFFDENGHLAKSRDFICVNILERGLHPFVRTEAWKFLTGYYSWQSSQDERLTVDSTRSPCLSSQEKLRGLVPGVREASAYVGKPAPELRRDSEYHRIRHQEALRQRPPGERPRGQEETGESPAAGLRLQHPDRVPAGLPRDGHALPADGGARPRDVLALPVLSAENRALLCHQRGGRPEPGHAERADRLPGPRVRRAPEREGRRGRAVPLPLVLPLLPARIQVLRRRLEALGGAAGREAVQELPGAGGLQHAADAARAGAAERHGRGRHPPGLQQPRGPGRRRADLGRLHGLR